MSRTAPTIIVRERTNHNNGGRWWTTWSEETRSWKKAWAIVDQCGADRDACRKWQAESGLWFLDIGGVEERTEFKAFLADLDVPGVPRPVAC